MLPVLVSWNVCGAGLALHTRLKFRPVGTPPKVPCAPVPVSDTPGGSAPQRVVPPATFKLIVPDCAPLVVGSNVAVAFSVPPPATELFCGPKVNCPVPVRPKLTVAATLPPLTTEKGRFFGFVPLGVACTVPKG